MFLAEIKLALSDDQEYKIMVIQLLRSPKSATIQFIDDIKQLKYLSFQIDFTKK